MGFIQNPTYSSPYRGCLVKKAADQTGANYTTETAIAWDAEEYDTSAIHDTVTNNTRLTVPADVTRVRLKGGVRITAQTADTYAHLNINKNASTALGVGRMSAEVGATSHDIYVESAVLTVTAGDYFELTLTVETDTSVDISAALSWFAMEIVE